MIVVAGGTGRLGSRVVTRLAERGLSIRVLTRDLARASHLDGMAEVVEADVRHPETLRSAVAGADVVVSAIQGFAGPGRVSPASIDRDGNMHLIDAAVDAGAAVVMVSVVGAAADSPMELFRCKYEAEQHLQRAPIPWTIVRASAFAELWAEIVGKGIVFGRGDNPVNFVAVDDVAAAAERAVVDDHTRGRIIEIGGENLTFNEFAAVVRDARGAPARVRHVPRWLLRTMAPLHRQPRAALVMDTTDMTFEPSSDFAPTPIHVALSPRPAVAPRVPTDP